LSKNRTQQWQRTVGNPLWRLSLTSASNLPRRLAPEKSLDAHIILLTENKFSKFKQINGAAPLLDSGTQYGMDLQDMALQISLKPGNIMLYSSISMFNNGKRINGLCRPDGCKLNQQPR
jgi:hypothetical protein